MQQSSTTSIQSEIDEAALKDLLQLVPNRPRLTGLKLCLADLKRDVKELNLQLGDRYCKYFCLSSITEQKSCQVARSHSDGICKDRHPKFLGEIQSRLCRELWVGDTFPSPLLHWLFCSAESTACWQEMKTIKHKSKYIHTCHQTHTSVRTINACNELHKV